MSIWRRFHSSIPPLGWRKRIDIHTMVTQQLNAFLSFRQPGYLSDRPVSKLAENRDESAMNQRAREIRGQALVALRTLSVKGPTSDIGALIVCLQERVLYRIFSVIRSAATRATRCYSCLGYFLTVLFDYMGVEWASTWVLSCT